MLSAGAVGVATTAELLAAGLTEVRIRWLVRRRVLVQVCRGVYAAASKARLARGDPRQERVLLAAAAVALAGPRAVVSHHDAAVIHRLALLEAPSAGVCSISRPPAATRGRRLRSSVNVHTAALPSRHVTVAAGLPVTTVARTVMDLARTMPFRSGVVVADSALHEQKTSAAEFQEVIDDCTRWPGIGKARQVAAFSHPSAESPFESIGRVAFRDGGLPPPVLQAWISGGQGRMIGRVDFLWVEHGTIAETDGAMKYADPDRARQQLRRDAELRQAGFEVVHITWAELLSDPDRVVRSIRAAFGRHAALRSRAG
jgi:hypothetical protein